MTDIERMKPGDFDADDEGYWDADDEAGPDGFAKGVVFAFYIEAPDTMLETYWPASQPDWDGFRFNDDELRDWPTWMQRKYPSVDFPDNGEVLVAEVYGQYEEGEDTTALFFRVSVGEFNNIRNRWGVYYHGLLDFMADCRSARDEGISVIELLDAQEQKVE
jgi:hypothetical protein